MHDFFAPGKILDVTSHEKRSTPTFSPPILPFSVLSVVQPALALLRAFVHFVVNKP